MMKFITYIAMAIVLLSCANIKSTSSSYNYEDEVLPTTVVNELNQPQPILVNTITRAQLAINENGWYNTKYKNYTPDTSTVSKLKSYLKNNEVHVVVFMGTWCADSHEYVPQFFKIADALSFTDYNIIGVTSDKKTDNGLEEKYKVFNVPTFIFLKDGKELNRMVEYPIESMEKDMLAIFTTNTYKNPYADF